MYSKVLDMTIKDTFSKEVGDISFALKPVVLWQNFIAITNVMNVRGNAVFLFV